ncbi:MAG: GNAT family N-acetyltransferase [Casimicrobiaceae bacterium]
MAMIGTAVDVVAAHGMLHRYIPRVVHRRVTLVVAGAESWSYFHRLACSNMTPYLERRGQHWNATAWERQASSRDFLLVLLDDTRVGFASIYDDPDNQALHLGDLQLEPEARGRGVGGTCLELIADIARDRSCHGVKLHVFRDNPARRLYERHGFRTIDRGFDKLTLWRAVARPLTQEGHPA